MTGEAKRGRPNRGGGRTVCSSSSEMIMIKKGPWKAEEDEVLLCHVSRHGPREWSSIQSKGLLQRTGKSCRLRWVNKLRPNLKIGVKFSEEEERVVIELQGQFGNRWARIATHLPGRTDNDVKNFWSSRQKRLAKLIQNPSSTPSSVPKSSYQNKRRNRNEQVHLLSQDDCPTQSKVPKLCLSADEESSSSLVNNNSHLIQMLPLPNHVLNPTPISCGQYQFQPELDPVMKSPTQNPEPQQFPPVTDLLPEFQIKEDFETITNFFDVFRNFEASSYGGDDDMAQFPFLHSCRIKIESPVIIFDELPLDMFDQAEPLQNPPPPPHPCRNI